MKEKDSVSTKEGRSVSRSAPKRKFTNSYSGSIRKSFYKKFVQIELPSVRSSVKLFFFSMLIL